MSLLFSVAEVFRYDGINGVSTVIYKDHKGGEHRVRVNRYTHESEELPLYDFEIASTQAFADLSKLGFKTHQEKIAKDFLSLFETDVPKRYDGKWFYSATVYYEGSKYRVTVHVGKRQVAKVTSAAYEHVTKHAVERAKQRWGIDLNSDYVDEIVKQMDAGRYTLHNTNDDCITVTLNVASETIGLVYNPEDRVIVTFIPNKNLSEIY
jgi:hypothetical protein